ncbi:MAG: hypothetical protein ACM3JQ_05580 [Candidatus Eiseniibacteriota bacterium]|jgi:hypothetical protein
MEDKIQKTLKFTILYMAVSICIVDGLIIFADSMQKYPTIIWALIVTGSSASTLGIIALFRHGLHGVHGKSYLFLTLGLIMWLTADITLAYYYYGFGIEEQKLVSFTDFFWILGYVFLSLHLITILRMLRKKINFKIIIVPTIATALLIIFNITSLTPQELTQEELEAFVITIAYPILDLSLIIPSALILVNFWRDYQQSIPWFLSSLSLLVNAIADDGYVRDFVNHNVHNLWFWDLFYVADFIIMAGALYWYNRFHISSKLINNKRNY